MSLSKDLQQIFVDLGFTKCGYCFKKGFKDFAIVIDNPFSGWDSESERESFILDLACYLTMDKSIGFDTKGKITLELSTIFKVGDGPEVVQNAEEDLKEAVARILQRNP